jgi:hypothetical protein
LPEQSQSGDQSGILHSNFDGPNPDPFHPPPLRPWQLRRDIPILHPA